MQEVSNGIKPRRRTPKQLERQFNAFQLAVVGGRSARQIARKLNVNRKTVVADLRHEQERRAAETRERREGELTRAVTFYEGVIAKALRKSHMCDIILERALADTSGRTRASITDYSLSDAIKARTRIDKLLGVEPIMGSPLTELLDALELP